MQRHMSASSSIYKEPLNPTHIDCLFTLQQQPAAGADAANPELSAFEINMILLLNIPSKNNGKVNMYYALWMTW